MNFLLRLCWRKRRMNTMQTGIVTLIKCAVTQKCAALPADFDLEIEYPKVKRHHMASLIYEGALHCGISADIPVMKTLLQSYCKSVLISERQMREVQRICAAFDENEIDYMLLKGCKMKTLYPKAELRTMGDADILIRMEQYDRIAPIMESLGFSTGVESDHELQWIKNSLFLELHKRVVPSYNQDFFAYFGDGWKLAVKQQGTRYEMLAEDEMVYLFTHFAKHYRDGGIGCRHVLDLWMFLRANPQMDEEKVKAELEKLQLREFYENVRRMIAVWFEDAPCDEKTDFITDFIFASGSFGRSDTHLVSTSLREGDGKNNGRGAGLNYLLRLAFPGVDALKNRYTVLQKAPWMLPMIWVYRPLAKLISKEGRHLLAKHQRNMSALTPDTIRDRQEALQYVGLEYHF